MSAKSVISIVLLLVAASWVSADSSAQKKQAESYSVPEAYDIYGSIIPSEWPVHVARAKRLVFRAETVSYEMCLKPEAGSDRRLNEAIENFVRLNESPWLLEKRLPIELPYEFVPTTELTKLMSDYTNGWNIFYARYPDSKGWIDLSAIGFSSDKTVAIAYMGHHCGLLCGGGHFHVLEKREGQWQPLTWKGTSCSWVSE